MEKNKFKVIKGKDKLDFTILEFNAKYPDDDACLDEIFRNRFATLVECPHCFKPATCETGFSRVSDRKCYACQWCSFQLHPLADTIFHKSDTSLKKWFYAIYLFSISKNGVSAKELERHLGVTYKTAWRIAKQIRLLFGQTEKQLRGTVEVDETYIGGSDMNRHAKNKKGHRDKKSVVVGMLERKGRLIAKVTSSSKAKAVIPLIRKNVKIDTSIMTDEWGAYVRLDDLGYKHKTIKHKSKEYVRGKVHTNTIEGFWSQLKRSINGTYHCVSPKYLQTYVDEFSYRYGASHQVSPLFYPILRRAATLSLSDQ